MCYFVFSATKGHHILNYSTSTSHVHIIQYINFSFFWTTCQCFGTFMHMILYNCLLFHIINCLCHVDHMLSLLLLCWINSQHLGIINCKNQHKMVQSCHNGKHNVLFIYFLFIYLFYKCALNWWITQVISLMKTSLKPVL